MTIVLDADLIVSLVLPLPWSETAAARLLDWKRRQVTLAAPALWTYDVGTVLRRALVTGHITGNQLSFALEQIRRIQINTIPDSPERQDLAFSWAARLNHTKLYGSSYLAAAESLQAEFWTADQSLVRAARALGAGWIHPIQPAS